VIIQRYSPMIDRDEYNARLSVLEEQFKDLKDDFKIQAVKQSEWLSLHTQILADIRNEQAKMKGFWGGLTFGLSAVVTIVSIVLTSFFEKP